MLEPPRPDPDALLATVKAEEQRQARGKLKVVLGYAAGVGKTYAMLEAAQQRKREGVDVVLGFVETHRRAETDALLLGLEIIPRKRVEYRGTVLEEMDIDAVLARGPQLALVDEFAHTNAPGSRHPKRFQDVAELLGAGIDIYTTLNIQHLESLNDIVAQITGVTVRETIPDRVLDEADEIEVVDLPPGELVRRLKEGKVYVPEQAARAVQRFFRQGNLTALREIALRRAAERVDNQMLAYMQARAIPGPWPAHERLLVLVSPSGSSERLVRTARRLADELDAEWSALYVEAPGHAALSPERREQVARVLHLAEDLGARVVTLPGTSVAEASLAYARKHNITKIIAGRPLRPRWRELLSGSVSDQLLHRSGAIDVYLIGSDEEARPAAQRAGWRLPGPLRRYVQSSLLVVGATVMGFLLDPALSLEKWKLFLRLLDTGLRPTAPLRDPVIEQTNLVMVYLAAVVVSALNWGRGPAILASVLSVVCFDFLFVAPYLTFAVSDTQYLLTFIGLLVVGVVMSTLAARAREQAEAAQRRESETAELYDLSRDLAAAVGIPEILRTLVQHVEQTFGSDVVVLLPSDTPPSRLAPSAASSDLKLDEHEMAVADWVYRHGQPAGPQTDTLPAARLRYIPLKTVRGVVGVLGVGWPSLSDRPMRPEERRTMEVIASQASLAIERARLGEAARQAEVLQATEKLQTALLSSISHDLRTPLVSITGALSSLCEDASLLADTNRANLIDNAHAEAVRLNRLVGNLLDMTRLEAGALRLSREPCDVQDMIGAALTQMEEALRDRRLTLDVPEDLPLVPMDFVTIVQVLVNLLDNAQKYSSPDTPIDVRARAAGAFLEIEVSDRGLGIPKEDLRRIFDKFYRVQRPESIGGTGLGLSICRGIVEAHGGFIAAENRPGGGTTIAFALPLRTPPARIAP
ncbi:MAG: two-component sensor histidine kinase [Chloroflexi bacterium RBG_13_68_17]|nr:MAG: two-component sensor histidine kinase [Chloroflexi bacterium RBG_13_68_17]